MSPPPLPPNGEILLYQTEDGRTRIECRFQDETLWLSQALIADLFQVTVPTVNEHLKNIFDDQELDREATIRNFRIVRREGTREVAREIEHYSLDAILAVGYRVRSPRGTQFRRWATERLREYLVKGFTIDDERLKNPPVEGSGVPDYFDELLERIRDIRASERRMYLRVKEIFALAADYDPAQQSTVEFFKLDFAEDQARRRKQVFLKDWETKLKEFLVFNDRAVLAGAGSISKNDADARAEAEYERFAARRRTLLEAEGERTSLKSLEDTAKARPTRKKKPSPKKPDSQE